ncbi:MAG: glycogen synthase GlgA [Desulfurella sp.]|uniref:Glycogen synthase n=1 Tax=Desulfurella multipotens TaxID=79269 RepID=A0A1G6I4M5_9BACT|nr:MULTISPECIES: glycogen synthase GlgA [Desulfurella]PMP65356.1 MAG: glycogen synthase GlgA [Desulfurella multipotens]PMP92103.1 MAG: glycogen synthase GlgA [Desulfurella sp.]SDC01380.1 starch synthase [Desulfurella multipotens]
MNVVIASSEVFPFSKTGGLADVAGALPKALAQNGLNISVFSPLYKTVDRSSLTIVSNVEVDFNHTKTSINLYETQQNNCTFYFIENQNYYNRDYLYGIGAQDYEDNALRFGFFSKAVLDSLKTLNIIPDILHTNDWQSALINVYLKVFYKNIFTKTKTVFTIHNLGYQGIFDKNYMNNLELPWELFTIDGLEYYDKINFLKGGIVFADAVTTVSKTYALEIQTPEFGFGLDGLLKKFSYKLSGIVNGIDVDVWDPKSDKFIDYNFNNPKDKIKNKNALQKLLGLPIKEVPVFGVVSRLAAQKGMDIFSSSVKELLESNTNVQFIILGSGEKDIEDQLSQLASQYKDKISLNLKFDEPLAHKIYASSDFFVMPSKYEPCGLGQMIAYRYGTLPIVRATGGLKDTVKNYSNRSKNPTGFVFEKYDSKELTKTIKKAIELFNKKDELLKIAQYVMSLDYSWKNQAKEYIKLYKKIYGYR